MTLRAPAKPAPEKHAPEKHASEKHALLRLAPCVLAAALTLAIAGCGGAGKEASASTAAPRPTAGNNEVALTEAQMAEEVAAALQACSYDGSPVSVNTNGLSRNAPTDCRDMIQKIMDFTGLPQNFEIVEADVPNAAAMIVMGEDKLPKRVIAFNNQFMDVVRKATDQNNWAPVSIMAHEVGHHLSGHTITPGGSQPPIELEADKFSGFVLYKMGATLNDSTKAILALGPESDGPTHPSRDRRATAIGEGWKQACRQQGGKSCDSGMPAAAQQSPSVVTSAASGVAATTPATQAAPAAAPRPTATAPANTHSAPVATATAAGPVDHLPAPDAKVTPSKFTQFVYDETGMVEPQVRAKFEKDMYEHARQHGVEIVTLIVDDLHGMDGNAYAWAMLRQLRVGKLDVGNGAVFVYAPKQNQVGLAAGPGVALAHGLDRPADVAQVRGDMARTLQTIAFSCKKGCRSGSSEMFFGKSDWFRRDTDDVEWTVRYQSYGDIWSAFKQDWDARKSGGGNYDLKKDPVTHKIARLHGKVVAINPVSDKANGVFVNDVKVRQGYTPVQIAVPEGHEVVLYVAGNVQDLMPGGKLQVGKQYAFIARADNLTWNAAKDTQSFDLLSYDLM